MHSIYIIPKNTLQLLALSESKIHPRGIKNIKWILSLTRQVHKHFTKIEGKCPDIVIVYEVQNERWGAGGGMLGTVVSHFISSLYKICYYSCNMQISVNWMNMYIVGWGSRVKRNEVSLLVCKTTKKQ